MEQYIVALFCLSEDFMLLTDNNHLACDGNDLEITIQLATEIFKRDFQTVGQMSL